MKIMTALAAGTVGIFSLTPAAYALPKLDSIVTSGVTISTPNVSNMNIGSTATNNVLKWKDFSIGSGETVTFDSKNYVNLVTGSNMSGIWGTLKGGGDIYLINPHGVLFGAGSTVDVGSLYVSTASITGDDFNTLKNAALSTSSSYTGDIVNMGTLKADHNITLAGNNLIFASKADDSGIANLTAGTGTNDKVKFVVNNGGLVQVGGIVYDENGTGITPTASKHTSGTGRITATTEFQLVRNKTELQNINNNLSGTYMLAGDIDMSGVTNFTPLGGERTATRGNPFQGRFNGLNYAIKNLNISSTGQVGLFGYVASAVVNDNYVTGTGIVENVGRIGGSTRLTASNTGYMAGAIAGQILGRGQLYNVYNKEGTVESVGKGMVGGIVGSIGLGELANAYNTGIVKTYDGNAGGIAGVASSNALIQKAYNTGDISDIGPDTYTGNVGGIVGLNQSNATIKEVYNQGTISAPTGYAGGIVGYANGSDSKVQSAYNTGNVNASIAYDISHPNATIENSYNVGTVVGSPETWNTHSASSSIVNNGITNLNLSLPAVGTPYSVTVTKQEYGDGTTDLGTFRTVSGTNYRLNTVTPKLLTVDVDGLSSTDGTVPEVDLDNLTLTLAGIVGTDAVSTSYTDKEVADGTATYTGLNLTGEKAGNYKLNIDKLIVTKATYDGTADISVTKTTSDGTYTINIIEPKLLTLTVPGISKQEDGTPDVDLANVQFSLDGVVDGDEVTVSATGATYDSASPGARTVTYTGLTLSGDKAGNYKIADTFEGVGTITAKPAPHPSGSSDSGSPGGPGGSAGPVPVDPSDTPLPPPTAETKLGDILPNGPGGEVPDSVKDISMRSLTEAENAVSPNVQTTNAPVLATAVGDNGISDAAPAGVSSGEEKGNANLGQNFLADGSLTMVNEGARPPLSMSASEVVAQQNGIQSASPASQSAPVAQNTAATTETPVAGGNESAATDTSAAGEENSTATDAETADTANQE